MSKPKHILVIRLSAMGDVAMTIPVIRAFVQQHPEVKLTVLTKAFFKPFFKAIDNVEVFSADVKGEHKGILGLWKLSRQLRHLGIDAVADLHDVLRSNILKRFLNKPFFQIDKGRAEKKALITGKTFEPLKTTHQRYVDVFEQLGYDIDMSQPEFPAPAILSPELQNFMSKDKQVIGIAPFAAHKSKMYPLDQMKQVIAKLSKAYHILLFGGGLSEEQTLKTFEAEFDHVISVAGKLTLDEELDIISNLDVMLSMDSGNGHLAAMLGIKTVTIWGVTHPHAGFAPFNQPESYRLLADREQFPLVPTSIYGNKYPESYGNAAGSISVDEVVNKVVSLL